MDPSVSVATIAQTISVTSGPEINNQQFQGWYIHDDGSLEAINCPDSQSLLTTANYAECCDIGATTCSTFWTDCIGSVAIGVGRNTCGPESYCQTVSIFDQLPLNGALIHSQIICGPSNWAASSIYRTVVTTSTTFSLSTYTAAASVNAASIASSTPSTTPPMTASGAQSNSADSTATPSATQSGTSSSHSSQAWIAGAVIGPIAAIAIVALLVWVFYLRKKLRLNRGTSTFTGSQVYTDDRNDMSTVQTLAESRSHGSQYGDQDNTVFRTASQGQLHEMYAKQQHEPRELAGSD